jgi:hypothetical protein
VQGDKLSKGTHEAIRWPVSRVARLVMNGDLPCRDRRSEEKRGEFRETHGKLLDPSRSRCDKNEVEILLINRTSLPYL